MSFHVGEDIGDYQIVAIIGAGSMGRVFQVEHRLTKRKEAAKILSAELATDVQIRRFEREMAVQAHLNHPNIATLHNAFRWNGCLVLIMEYLEGRTLEKALNDGRLPIETGVNYIRQTLSALAYAHDRGVVHRDVTPANLIITQNGTVKLTDFGISKSFGDIQLTNYGDIVGSLDYLAPEQARGSSQPDRRSDLYSVGVILYQILTGAKPFGADRRFAPIVTDSEGEPRQPTDVEPLLAPEWNHIVGKALIRDRASRYSSASEFLQAIDQASPARAERSLAMLFNIPIAGASIAVAAMLLVWISSRAFGQLSPPAAITFHIPPPSLETGQRASPIPSKEERRIPMPTLPRHRTDESARRPQVEQSVPAQGPEAASQVVEQSVTDDSEPPASMPASRENEKDEPKKTRIWSKLNPFKKRTQNAP